MAKRRASQAPLGLTSNGLVVVNVLALLSERELKALRQALPSGLGNDWFVGAAVGVRAANQLLERMDDAAAEGAARVTSQRKRRP